MKHLNSDLKYLAVKKFPQGGSSLFGEDFGNKAKTAVDNIRALKGIQFNKSHFQLWWLQEKDKVHVSEPPTLLGHHSGTKQISLPQVGQDTIPETAGKQAFQARNHPKQI